MLLVLLLLLWLFQFCLRVMIGFGNPRSVFKTLWLRLRLAVLNEIWKVSGKAHAGGVLIDARYTALHVLAVRQRLIRRDWYRVDPAPR